MLFAYFTFVLAVTTTDVFDHQYGKQFLNKWQAIIVLESSELFVGRATWSILSVILKEGDCDHSQKG